ncbi:hypothetical protein [Nocardia sp. NPDC050710]
MCIARDHIDDFNGTPRRTAIAVERMRWRSATRDRAVVGSAGSVSHLP